MDGVEVESSGRMKLSSFDMFFGVGSFFTDVKIMVAMEYLRIIVLGCPRSDLFLQQWYLGIERSVFVRKVTHNRLQNTLRSIHPSRYSLSNFVGGVWLFDRRIDKRALNRCMEK